MAAHSIDTMGLAGDVLGLGNPRMEYRARANKPWLFVAFLAIIGAGACGIGALGMWVGESLAIVGIILGLLLISAAVALGYTAVNNRGLRVVEFEQGLVRIANGQSEIVRWDEVTDVYQQVTNHYTNGIHTGTTHLVTVIHGGIKTAYNDSIKDIEALGEAIQRETTTRLLPKYVEAYNSGGTVRFGKLTLSKAGVSNGSQTLRWDEVHEVRLKGGMIAIRSQGVWFDWVGQATGSVPNLFIFLAMVDQIAGINQKRN